MSCYDYSSLGCSRYVVHFLISTEIFAGEVGDGLIKEVHPIIFLVILITVTFGLWLLRIIIYKYICSINSSYSPSTTPLPSILLSATFLIIIHFLLVISHIILFKFKILGDIYHILDDIPFGFHAPWCTHLHFSLMRICCLEFTC